MQIFSVQYELHIQWRDERLRYGHMAEAEGIEMIEGDIGHLNKIWNPGLHVTNNKEPGKLHSSQTPWPVLVQISPDGHVSAHKT